MAVHHRGVQDALTFSVYSEEHSTGISIVGYPLKIEPKQGFDVEIAVICLSKGCDLTGKLIYVGKTAGGREFSGKLTWKAFNARYGKYEYHGKVRCVAPEKVGTYQWYGTFPYQSRHKGSMTSFRL